MPLLRRLLLLDSSRQSTALDWQASNGLLRLRWRRIARSVQGLLLLWMCLLDSGRQTNTAATGIRTARSVQAAIMGIRTARSVQVAATGMDIARSVQGWLLLA